MNGFPYSFSHADALAAGLVRIVLPLAPKKGLITDLDDTLWSGILGDDGLEGVSWDVDHKTGFHGLYQQLLNVLADAGILLGVASKNDAGLVGKALGRRDLVVESRHLFPIETRWGPKPESVERILEAWNVGPDSVVFVDDSRLELAQVKAAFPTMECLEFRRDDPRFLSELRDHFGKREIRQEDKLRVASLRDGQAVRQAADGASLDALLAGAQARVTFRWGKQPPDPRALELINKTNQFNLNGVRYTQADWNAYLSDPATHLVVVEYQDRFGRLGKIAALAGRERDKSFDVDVWVMSCRAFSRRIEHQCVKVLLSRWESLYLRCERTERNAPMLDFLSEAASGCQAIQRADVSRWCPPLFHQTECLNV
jgi:FkbH-like protein